MNNLDGRRYLHPDEEKALRAWVERERAWALQKGRRLAMRNVVLVETLLGTGVRRFEVAGLRVGDVQIGRGHQEICIAKGKGGKPRTVKLPDELKQTLREYLDFKTRSGEPTVDEAPLFQSSRGGHLDVSAVHRIWDHALAAAGVEHRPGVACHAARHGYAVALYRTTKDLRLVQQQLGHASPTTTMIYASLLDEDVVAGVNACWKSTRP